MSMITLIFHLCLMLCIFLRFQEGNSFQFQNWPSKQRLSSRSSRIILPKRQSSKATLKAEIRGDPLRDSTGIRPSLHPVTINAIAEVLKIRAKNSSDMPLRVADGVEPIQIALTAGKIAADAIQKRQATSNQDGMTLDATEQQTVAGRVVGVSMRLDDLEKQLAKKCQGASWIAKYGEWDSFGVLPQEAKDVDDLESLAEKVDDRIKVDPLFSMNRAECLLALFLDLVERPELSEKKVSVPDGSEVDFLDADRQEVLLSMQ